MCEHMLLCQQTALCVCKRPCPQDGFLDKVLCEVVGATLPRPKYTVLELVRAGVSPSGTHNSSHGFLIRYTRHHPHHHASFQRCCVAVSPCIATRSLIDVHAWCNQTVPS